MRFKKKILLFTTLLFFAIILLKFSSPISQIQAAFNPDTDPALVGYWKMDEASWNGTAGEVIDSKDSKHGTAIGANTVSSQPGYGRAALLAGSSYLDISSATSLLSGGNLTISLWFKANSTGSLQHILWVGDPVGNGWGLEQEMHISIGSINQAVTTSNVINFELADGSNYQNNVAPQNDLFLQFPFTNITNYHHVAITITGGTSGKMYLDGSEVANDQSAVIDKTAWTKLYIGRAGSISTPRYFSGIVDDVRIYNRVLSSSEITTLFTYTPPPPPPLTACGTTGQSKATGLVSTPALTGSFVIGSTGACVVDPKAAFAPFALPTYDSLKSLYYTQSKANKILIPGFATESDLSTTTSDTVYSMAGNMSLSGNPPGTKTFLVFVEANLNITGNYTYGSANTGTVFVVKGNVNIRQDVTQIDAIIMSAGTICTAYDFTNVTCPASNVNASQLVINGSLISLNASLPIKFRRTLTDNTQPAEKIIHQAKYLVILRDLLSDTFQKWSELGE